MVATHRHRMAQGSRAMKSGFRVFCWLVGGLALLLVLGVLVVLAVVGKSKGDLASYRAELEARGESFDPATFKGPNVPTTDNGAPEVLAAAGLISLDHLEKIQLFGYRTIEEIKERQGKTVDWDDLAAALEPAQVHLAAIRKAASAPTLAINSSTSTSRDRLTGKLFCLRAAEGAFTIDTLLKLQKGERTAALENIETLLRISRIPGRLPDEQCQVHAAAFLNSAFQLTSDFLPGPATKASELIRLQKAWEEARPQASLSDCLRIERIFGLQDIDAATGGLMKSLKFPQSRDDLKDLGNFAGWTLVYRYADERQLIENFQTVLDAIPATPPVYRDLFAMANKYQYRGGQLEAGRMWSTVLSAPMRNQIEIIATSETLSNMAIAAIAIRRYQLDHGGASPPSLQALIPQYLVSVPRDPMDGQPLRYRPEKPPVLYSIGGDGIDHGGNGKPYSVNGSFLECPDIVWPRTALQKESAKKQ